MKVEQIKKLPPIQRLLQWIRDREEVRIKKESGQPPPWTDNEIIQCYRFTCPRRMDDKVSRWLLKHWYMPNFNHKNILLACAVARFLNLPESLEAIGFPKEWHPSMDKQVLRKRREEGHTVFNSAYMVRGNDGQDKLDSVYDYYIQPLIVHGL